MVTAFVSTVKNLVTTIISSDFQKMTQKSSRNQMTYQTIRYQKWKIKGKFRRTARVCALARLDKRPST